MKYELAPHFKTPHEVNKLEWHLLGTFKLSMQHSYDEQVIIVIIPSMRISNFDDLQDIRRQRYQWLHLKPKLINL